MNTYPTNTPTIDLHCLINDDLNLLHIITPSGYHCLLWNVDLLSVARWVIEHSGRTVYIEGRYLSLTADDYKAYALSRMDEWRLIACPPLDWHESN
jgi:hypothetical protein